MVRFIVTGGVVTTAPFGGIPVFFSATTECIQCEQCHMVFGASPTATYDPTAGHICEQQIDLTASAWAHWGLSTKDPGPEVK